MPYYNCCISGCTNNFSNVGKLPRCHIWHIVYFCPSTFSYPEPFLRAVRRGALAKSISNWHLIGYNERYCSNTGYILLPCFYGIRFLDLARAPRRTARKKGSGYENGPSKQVTRPSPLLDREMTNCSTGDPKTCSTRVLGHIHAV